MSTRSIILALLLTAAGPATAHATCDEVGSLPKDHELFHGAPVGMFTWRRPELNPAPPFNHPRSPDGPAWFAENWQFSIHAGVRFLIQKRDTSVFLHRYELTQQVAMLICDGHRDFSRTTRIDTDQGDYEMALEFCRKYEYEYNGYVFRRDAVRGEAEVILCRPADVLHYEGTHNWWVSQTSAGGVAYTGAVGFDFANREWTCVLNNQDLADFSCQPPPNAPGRGRRR